MLRRKMILFLGTVVVLLVAMAVAAILLLQDVLERQDHVSHEALAAVEQINTINADMARIQVELYQLQLGRERRLDELMDRVDSLHSAAVNLGKHYLMAAPASADYYRSIIDQLPGFERHVGALATARDEELAMAHNQSALTTTIQMQRGALSLGAIVRGHASDEQRALATRFRWTVILLTAVFLLVINASIIVLLQMARMVVEPAEKLVRASRELARGKFDTRVHVRQRDEFGELGESLNHLAEQLEATEQRRLDVLQHVALTLNHELNNVSTIIELQLNLLKRRSGHDPAQEKSFLQIHNSLQRMTQTVHDLRLVRRIVLTEYTEGVQMLDLKESMKENVENIGA